MDIPQTKLKIFISGKQPGVRWNNILLLIDSGWDAGCDGEKFEVLAAIRKAYPFSCGNSMPAGEKQTPFQLGRSEGFIALSYIRVTASASPIVIVPAVMASLRLVPRPAIETHRRDQMDFPLNVMLEPYRPTIHTASSPF